MSERFWKAGDDVDGYEIVFQHGERLKHFGQMSGECIFADDTDMYLFAANAITLVGQRGKCAHLPEADVGVCHILKFTTCGMPGLYSGSECMHSDEPERSAIVIAPVNRR